MACLITRMNNFEIAKITGLHTKHCACLGDNGLKPVVTKLNRCSASTRTIIVFRL